MMKQIILFINIFLIVNTILIYGQSDQQREQIRRELRERDRINKDFKRIRDLEIKQIDLSVLKLSKQDKQLIAPDEADKSEYAAFLRLPDTEIIKILNAPCLEIGNTESSDGCKSGIPGYGSFYSFNHESHLFPNFSNIQLIKDRFVTTGFLTQGMIVSLGEVDIEKLSLQSDGVKFLAAFTPAAASTEFEKQTEEIRNGIDAGGYIYRRAEKVKENTVYAMRSVSYRSKNKPASFDRRKDIIVVFKVIRREKNGNVILIWRSLQSKNAPKLREE